MDDAELEKDRQRHLDALLASDAPLKVIVAGAGTGKTHSFKELLKTRPTPRLVLTFINNLVQDLAEDLGDLATVQTLHGFARALLHKHAPEGVSHGCQYYPLLSHILAADATVMRGRTTTREMVEQVFHLLDETNNILEWAIRSGNYYDAVGHTDSVYRVVRHLRDHPGDVPKYGQVVVDEYQDFSLLEIALIDLLSEGTPTLIVGDDDQALYSFKTATPEELRRVADAPDYVRFDLPYCSRCPEVLVRAVDRVVDTAQGRGLLQGRIAKPYHCYLPAKRTDSERYPKIIHARCSVQTAKAPILARYVEQMIREIPEEEIVESWAAGHPTAVVIGPAYIAKPVYEHLRTKLRNVSLKMGAEEGIDSLEGYRLLARDERSRLGWRILTIIDPPQGVRAMIARALEDQEELVELLPPAYVARHLVIARALRGLMDEIELSQADIDLLVEATGRDLGELRRRLGLEKPEPPAEPDRSAPSVLVTSLVGAKGLQASHLFVVGVNGEHFPRDNAQPTDDEVCQLIVALTRATKQCHLVSVGRFGNQSGLRPGIFVRWLGDYVEVVRIDAASLVR